jgi:cyclic pyranopterin phosphate synthase
MHNAKMVDISEKPDVYREAVAKGFIRLRKTTIKRIKGGRIAKGDPLLIAKIAGIMAAKQTPFLIPLTHPLPITGVDINTKLFDDGVEVEAIVKTNYKTGCEIDALFAVATALLAIFDICKPYEKDKRGQYPQAFIEKINVVRKEKTP